jgi:chloramphenicol O-acetyltransferase type A
MTQGRFIDLDRWKRREHFAIYRALAHPFWSVTVDVDVTPVWDAAAREERSFFLATSFAALQAANDTEAFRLRIRPDGIWCHEAVSLSTTVLRSDETFAFAVLRPRPSFNEFEADAKAVMARVQNGAELGMPPAGVDDLIYHSSLPWIRFTSFTNALGGNDDCIPRLVFGRATREGAVWRMPVAVEVHHGLVDGLDVARFLERFEHRLRA